MTRKFRTVGRSRPQLFRSRSRFLYPFSLLLPFVVSVFVLSVSEVSVSHCIIAKSCLRRFMLGQSVRASVICLLCSKHVTSLFPFSVTGRGMFRSLIVTLFCNFMISNLSWNTNDETLRQVRLILFCCFLSVVRVPDDLVFCVSPPPHPRCYKAFSAYGSVVDVRISSFLFKKTICGFLGFLKIAVLFFWYSRS